MTIYAPPLLKQRAPSSKKAHLRALNLSAASVSEPLSPRTSSHPAHHLYAHPYSDIVQLCTMYSCIADCQSPSPSQRFKPAPCPMLLPHPETPVSKTPDSRPFFFGNTPPLCLRTSPDTLSTQPHQRAFSAKALRSRHTRLRVLLCKLLACTIDVTHLPQFRSIHTAKPRTTSHPIRHIARARKPRHIQPGVKSSSTSGPAGFGYVGGGSGVAGTHLQTRTTITPHFNPTPNSRYYGLGLKMGNPLPRFSKSFHTTQVRSEPYQNPAQNADFCHISRKIEACSHPLRA